MTLLAVYDSKAEHFLPPYFAMNRAVGVRQFQAACSSEGHQFNQFGADFTLFELGTFDQGTGQLKMHDTHENLGNGITHSASMEGN